MFLYRIFLELLLSLILSILSQYIMAYISMTTSLGPWIEISTVLLSIILFRLFNFNKFDKYNNKSISLITACSGISGIIATAVGFSMPVLYFIDSKVFNLWFANPWMFCFYIGFLTLSAGSLGLMGTNLFYNSLILDERLKFAIGDIVYSMIYGNNILYNIILFLSGSISIFVFFILQTLKFFPKKMLIFKGYIFNILNFPPIELDFDLLPIFLCTGFIVGPIVSSVFFGLIFKYLIIVPLYGIYPEIVKYLNLDSVLLVNFNEFLNTFVTGILLFSIICGLYKFIVLAFLKFDYYKPYKLNVRKNFNLIEFVSILILNCVFFSYFEFSLLSQVYIIIFTFLSIHQLLIIAGKISIAPLGRYATLIMIPGLLIFGFDSVQTTLVVAFAEIASGVACDSMFSRKLACNASIDQKEMVFFNWMGLLISSLSIGLVFWLLISTFGLGESSCLNVARARSRAMLINLSMENFDLKVLFLGCFFGLGFNFLGINSALLLAGILMPTNAAIMLILGGFIACFFKNKERYYPLCSGAFTTNSLFIFFKTLFKI